MPTITHHNFGWLHAPPFPPACCHCLLVRTGDRVVLVDAGIGTRDVADPVRRVPKFMIEAGGFRFFAETTAVHQLAVAGVSASDITDIVLTHADPDHTGGLVDFPHARIHISCEEHANLSSGNARFPATQFEHGPDWVTYDEDDATWHGLPARRLEGPDGLFLVPLFGHTHGHCGVAIDGDDGPLLHCGDAYYLRSEFDDSDDPVHALAEMAAEDNAARLATRERLRTFRDEYGSTVATCCYHDLTELPEGIASFDEVAGRDSRLEP